MGHIWFVGLIKYWRRMKGVTSRLLFMLSVLYAYETYGQPTIVHHDTVNVVETKFFARDTIYCLARLMDSTGVAGYKRICPPHQSNWESIDYLMVDKAHRKEKEINILRINSSSRLPLFFIILQMWYII